MIDDQITYCGSQNCADPEFLVKAKFAPWVDAVVRFEGPVARQNQHLFASDWMANHDEDISDVLREPEVVDRAFAEAEPELAELEREPDEQTLIRRRANTAFFVGWTCSPHVLRTT